MLDLRLVRGGESHGGVKQKTPAHNRGCFDQDQVTLFGRWLLASLSVPALLRIARGRLPPEI